MTKKQKLDIALEKLKRLLELAPENDKENVRKELLKMIPENEKASVHPKIGWGYHDDLIQTGTTFKVVPCFASDKKTGLFELYSNLLSNSDFDITDKFIEGFDVILSENPKKIKMGFLPAIEIAEKTTACRISFKILSL